MRLAWEDPIKNSNQLTVFPAKALKQSSIWYRTFKNAIGVFNGFKLGVTLVETATAPDTENETGANIQCDIASGTAKGRAMKLDFSQPFDGSGIHGFTQPFARQWGNNLIRVVKCLVFVPAGPLVKPGGRPTGDGVKLFIMVHEFVHAAGQLNNDEHSHDSDPDVFCSVPQASLTVDAGRTPDGDHFRVGANTRLSANMLSARTAGLIIPNWQ